MWIGSASVRRPIPEATVQATFPRLLAADEDSGSADRIFRDLGEHRLRGILRPVRLVDVALPERAEDPLLQPRSSADAQPFAGQEEELADAARRSVSLS
jgi:hypothetical protein